MFIRSECGYNGCKACVGQYSIVCLTDDILGKRVNVPNTVNVPYVEMCIYSEMCVCDRIRRVRHFCTLAMFDVCVDFPQ